MGNSNRTEPVTVIGPRGLSRIMQAVRTIAPELPFEVNFIEIEGNEQTFLIDGMEITAFRVQHNIVCYTYEIAVKRKGRFNAVRAKAQEIPLRFWNPLQRGETIEDGGRIYTPEMVLGEERKGLKVVYATDTRPVPAITEHAMNADLLVCEGMYGEPGMDKKAREHRHMTMQEAAQIGKDAQPVNMWLTHYSPSLVRPDQYMSSVQAIYPNIIAAKDGQEITLKFEDE
jgi:ribonuclease Z